MIDSGWSVNQTKELFGEVKRASDRSEGLGGVFRALGAKYGRSESSIRNYYYSQIRLMNMFPQVGKELGIVVASRKREKFALFTENEMEKLVENILIRKANHESVRAIIFDLSGGDSKLALRLQNKYRSMITHHKSKVIAIIDRLKAQKIVFWSPYQDEETKSDIGKEKLHEFMNSLSLAEAQTFISILRKLN